MPCNHCGTRLYELDDGWVRYETETREFPHTEARCRDVLKAKVDTLRTAGDALSVLASSYAGDTGLHENGHLWGAIEEWERAAAVATK